MAAINFNPDSVTEDAKFDPIPPGQYLVEIVDSDIRETKSGSGRYVYLDMRVVEGPCEGRHVFDRLNHENDSQTASEIAQRALKRICRLCGIRGDLHDTQDLHFKRFNVFVTVKTDSYGQKNVVRYSDGPPQEQPRAQPPRQEAPAPDNSKPWQRKARF